ISLDEVQVFLDPAGSESGYMNGSDGLESPIWDMDVGPDGPSVVLLNSIFPSGSGQGDMFLDVPASLFTGPNQFVYLYSHFGGEGGPYACNDGFEEWAVRTPAVSLTPDIETSIFNETTHTGGITNAAAGDIVHDTSTITVDQGAPTPTGTV